jgi:Ca-activated chloride channel family protein
MRLLLIFSAALLAAQDPPPLAIRVDVNLVNVAFIVRDGSGALAGDLGKDDIEVFEDGVRQDVRFFGRSTDLPLRLALLVDASGSQGNFIRQHHRDLQKFLAGSVMPRDRAMLVCFGNHIRVVSDFSSSVGDLMERFNRFQKGDRAFPELAPDDTREGGTALFDSMYLTAARKLGPVNGERKALILFSDGEDNSSAHDLIDAIESAQAADALVYTVRYTEMKKGRLTARGRYGILEMDRLATETGGASFDASKKDIGDSLKEVAAELRSMYDIGYVSSHPDRDGMFHKVVIRAKKQGLAVRAKPGYYAR